MKYREIEIVEIIENFMPLIKSMIKNYCDIPHQFVDLVQEGRIEIMEALERYDSEKSHLPHFLKVHLTYFYRNRYKFYKRREFGELGENEETYDPYDELEKKAFIKDMLKTLPSVEAEILVQYYMRGMSVSEIARKLRIKTRTVYHLKDKALRKLRENFENPFY